MRLADTMLLISLGLVAAATVALVFGIHRLIADVPAEDRSFLDRPPLGFRLLWPLIRFVAFWTGGRLPFRWRQDVMGKLRAGAADFSISAEQYIAAQMLTGIIAGLLIYLIWMSDDRPGVVYILIAMVAGFIYPEIWIREQIRKRHRAILRVLPFYLDLITLGVEAGLSLTMAVSQAVEKSPPGHLSYEFGRYLRDIRAGKTRVDALKQMGERIKLPAVTKVVSSIVTAENMGASLGQALRLQSDQRRTERFQRAEKLALEAPVKMLGPLIIFIFPNTFIIIGFPIVMKFLHEGL